MKQIESSVSPFISSQFPSFYQEEGSHFVDFVKAYYQWMDIQGSESRKILSYNDVDTTVDSFLNNFRSQYLNALPLSSLSNVPFLVKHIQDLYKAKGSDQGYRLLFRILFDQDIDIYKPGDDMLKASDGVWIIPRYIECAPTDRAFTMLGKRVTGISSHASAYVDNVVRKRISGKFIDVIFLSGIVGNFITGEKITDDGDFTDAPEIVGSLNNIEVTFGGANNKTGEVFNISGNYARGGRAVVRSVENGTGRVSFSLIDSGYGYSNAAAITISSDVIFSSDSANYYPGDAIIQPQRAIQYINAVQTPARGNILWGYDGANTQIATGYVISVTPSSNTAGTLYISPTSNTWINVASFRLESNTSIYANTVSVTDTTQTATVVMANTIAIGLKNKTGALYANGYIQKVETRPIGITTSNTATKNLIGTNTYYTNYVSVDSILYARANNYTLGVVESITNNTHLVLRSNSSFTTSSNTAIWTKNVVRSSPTTVLYSSGSGANFSIGYLANTETVRVNTNILGGNNSAGVCFLDILLSGNNSGVASNGYGFAANTSLTLGNIINSALSYSNVSIGKISSLSNINRGSAYTASPLISIVEKDVSGRSEWDQNIFLSDVSGFFSVGHNVEQNMTVPIYSLSISGNATAFSYGEGVVQTTSAARGTVLSSNSTTLLLRVVSGVFVSGNNVVGQTSTANAAVSLSTSTPVAAKATGVVSYVDGSSIIVRRTSYPNDFSVGSLITGFDSGQTQRGQANISFISQDNVNKPMGKNSSVIADVVSANGVVTSLEVIDSGYGYSNSDIIQLTKSSDNTAQIVVGNALVNKQGVGTGFWKDNRGKISSDKHLGDNKYYQDFSYEIRSSLPLQTYADILKNVLHVAGTELYGKVIIQTEQGIVLSTAGIENT